MDATVNVWFLGQIFVNKRRTLALHLCIYAEIKIIFGTLYVIYTLETQSGYGTGMILFISEKELPYFENRSGSRRPLNTDPDPKHCRRRSRIRLSEDQKVQQLHHSSAFIH